MSKYIYKYVEYNCFSDNIPCVKYFTANHIFDLESKIFKIKGLDPKKNTLMIVPDMDDKNKWNFCWEVKSPLEVSSFLQATYGYIEKIVSYKEV